MRFLASGEILTTLDQDVFDGKTAREVKQTLAAHVGVSRFRQRLFTEGPGFREIHDDEVFGSASVEVQLVVLEFLPPDVEEARHLIDALRRNDSARVEEFLQGPRNPNLLGDEMKHQNPLHLNPLELAAWEGHVEVMRLLLEAGVDENAANTDQYEMSPMHYAALNGHLEVVRFLVELGADKNQPSSTGETPLHFAASKGHFGLVRFLVEVGANHQLTTDDGAKPSHRAAQNGRIDIFKFLVDVAASEDEATRDYGKILSLAIQEGHIRV